jgi:hypothetical protein
LFIAALFIAAKIWNQPRWPSMDEQKNKILCIYTMEYHSVIRKNKILSFTATWIEVENIMLSETR